MGALHNCHSSTFWGRIPSHNLQHALRIETIRSRRPRPKALGPVSLFGFGRKREPPHSSDADKDVSSDGSQNRLPESTPNAGRGDIRQSQDASDAALERHSELPIQNDKAVMEVRACVEFIKQRREGDFLSASEEDKLLANTEKILTAFKTGGIINATDHALVILGFPCITRHEIGCMAEDLLRAEQTQLAKEHATSRDSEIEEGHEQGLEEASAHQPFQKHPKTIMDDDASKFKPWWLELPYVCVLMLTSCGSFFMMDMGTEGIETFNVIGFEDPEDAFIAKSSLIHEPKGVRNLFQKKRDDLLIEMGIKPEKASDWGGDVEMTWFTGKEFAGILETSRSVGTVVPANTLRSIKHKPLKSLVQAMKESINNPPQNQQTNRWDSKNMNSDKGEPQPFDHQSSNIPGESYRKLNHSEELSSQDKDIQNEDFSTNPVPAPDYDERVEPMHESSTNGNNLDSQTVISEHDREKLVKRLNRSHSNYSFWWLDLEEIYVPQVQKPGGSGGAVEVNFAIIPDYEDYRLVLFEGIEDAQSFLNVFGTIVGEGALVRFLRVSPRKYLSEVAGVNPENIVMLAKGSLMLSNNMGYLEMVGAIRFATQFTAKKHGGAMNDKLPDSLIDEAGVDKKDCDMTMKTAADELMAGLANTFQDSDDQEEAHSVQADEVALNEDTNSDNIFSDVLEKAVLESLDVLESTSQESDELNSLKDKIQNNQSNPTRSSTPPPSSTPSAQNPKLDAEIVHEPKGPGRSSPDGTNVVYPPGWTEDSRGIQKDTVWYINKLEVYLPQYLDEANTSNFLAFRVGEEEIPVVLGFEDKHDAEHCAKVVGLFEEQKGCPTRVMPFPPKKLIAWCRSQNADLRPVILRKGSLPLELGMSKDQFVSYIGTLAQVQQSTL